MSRRPRWRQGRFGRRSDDYGETRPGRFERVRRGIFVLPALVTLCNFGCGFMSIIYSVEAEYVTASYLIIFAMLADMLDGAMARITRTESKFGSELDSLADVVSFGCAPALLIYQRFGLSHHPFWIFPLFYAIAGALRLARFNALDASTGSRDFRGTPIPAPAGVVVGLVLALEKEDMAGYPKWIVISIVFLLSYLMLCNIRYPSSKVILKPDRPYSFGTLVLLLLIIIPLFTHFVGAWLTLAAIYYVSGPYLGLRTRHVLKPAGETMAPDAPQD